MEKNFSGFCFFCGTGPRKNPLNFGVAPGILISDRRTLAEICFLLSCTFVFWLLCEFLINDLTYCLINSLLMISGSRSQ